MRGGNLNILAILGICPEVEITRLHCASCNYKSHTFPTSNCSNFCCSARIILDAHNLFNQWRSLLGSMSAVINPSVPFLMPSTKRFDDNSACNKNKM